MPKNDRIVLGTVQFGVNYGISNTNGIVEKSEVFKIFKFALQNGVDKLDTADAYGVAGNLIGEFHRTSQEKFSVNSKFRLSNGEHDLKGQLEISLATLQSAYIEVYFFHSFIDFVENRNALKLLRTFKEAGLIKKIGVSIYDNAEFEMAIAQKEIDVIQIPFNVLDNRSQRGLLLLKAKEEGKLIQARSVFLQGLLFLNPANLPHKLQPLKPYLEKFREIADHGSLSVAAACLTYVLSNPLIDQVLIGVDNLRHFEENIGLLNSTQPLTDYTEFDKLHVHVHEHELLYPKNW